MCSIDLRKAFDKVNHCGLYIRLMKRFVPTALLEVIENWLSGCYAFVKWYDSSSFVSSGRLGELKQRTFPAKTLLPYWSTRSPKPRPPPQKALLSLKLGPAHPRRWWTAATDVGPKGP